MTIHRAVVRLLRMSDLAFEEPITLLKEQIGPPVEADIEVQFPEDRGTEHA